MGKQSTLKMEVEFSLKLWWLFLTPHGATPFGFCLALHINYNINFHFQLYCNVIRIAHSV